MVLLGDAAHGPSPLSGQGTSLALVGARVLADELFERRTAEAACMAYETRMRPFVAENHKIASAGMQFLLPSSRLAIHLRNATLRVLPLLMRLGLGFGRKMEKASRAIDLPPLPANT